MLASLALAAAVRFAPATPATIEPGRDLYPAEALAAGVEGDVAVSLRVDATGGLRCAAHGDATLAPLKRASCQLIADRDVFLPARAKDGTPAANAFELVVRWRRQADESQFGGAVPIGRAWWVRFLDTPPAFRWNTPFARLRVGFDVTEGGRVENCTVERSDAGTVLTAVACPLVTRRALFLPAPSGDGQPRRTRGWFWIRWGDGSYLEDKTADAGSDGRALP